MQLTFILIGTIGLLLLIYSIRILIKSRKNKLVAEFTLDSESKEIQLDSNVLYSLSFLGAGFIDDQGKFRAELKSESGNLVKLNKTFPNYRFRKNGKLGLEYWHFSIDNSGKYILTFENLNDLIAKHSMLISKRMFQKEISPNNIKILLKEAVSTKNRLFSIVGLVIGVNALIWGILIGFTNAFG
ncbi:hypothetical protein JCM19294_1520 [Nonlabens tegetincola]|uniref:Uncharacterized protein n=1 Tax=Nonlabens tegetincola TaxID=323273 RepID=A0A090Q835_9FLAO|nr:hypothetical protein [Nonlabens tegetincola]GAK97898.1 hypothetical protein JCM19294_1520 [Nonlabens tegetincola]